MCTSAAAGALALTGVPAAASADPTITFRYATYTPNQVRIEPGQSVTWTGDPGNTFDLTSHPLKFADPSIAPQSDKSSSTTRSFARVGRFAFACVNHGWANMTGAVLVTANHLPAPAFDAPSSAAPGAPVTFDASGSSDPDPGQRLTYAWDFDGDGRVDESGPAATASFTYARAGTFNVTLKVTDTNAEPDIGPESATTTRPISIAEPGQDKSGPGSGQLGGGGASGNAGAPHGAGDDDRDDVVLVEVAGSTRTSAVRARGLAVRVTATERAVAMATLRVHSRVIGRATISLRAGGARTVHVALNRRGHSLLKRHARVRAELRIVLDDADATGTTTRRWITLRR
ncbi:MAG TPA: PKD domain-containing protein [Solirubrobacteraceae bacterium]